MEPMTDLPNSNSTVDQVQWRYEVIRPLVLFDDRTAAQRAAETHTHPETVRKLTRRFRHQGTLGLFPEHTEIVSPRRGQPVPATVVEELTRLKALYGGFGYRELARIIHYKCNERIDDKTVKSSGSRARRRSKESCPWAPIIARLTAPKLASRL